MTRSNCDSGSCGCCSAGMRAAHMLSRRLSLSRRNLLAGLGSTAVGAWAAGARSAGAAEAAAPERPGIPPATRLTVQPVLAYELYTPREQVSWRPWGGIMIAEDVADEANRIDRELRELAGSADMDLNVLPVARVRTAEEAARVRDTGPDVMLIYAANNGQHVLDALMAPNRPTLFFLRHKSGPISLWYEILHPRFLRKNSDEYLQSGVDVHDVVIDSYPELAWRLRALMGLRKTLGQRILAIGGAGGWGPEGHRQAPTIARDKWLLDIRDITYEDLGRRIVELRQDRAAVEQAKAAAAAYLDQPDVFLHCDRKFVDNAFLLYRLFKDLLAENDATALTVHHCMGTIIPMSETTACLPLTLLNDEGLLAFCESDFVTIPVGMLMHHITRRPVFLCNPTWPHDGMITIAHCTAPRKMDGRRYEPMEIHTHFESDYGAAPKVDLREGQLLTAVIADFGARKFVSFVGRVIDNPFHPICRSQTNITIDGDWKKLVEDMRGFHWMTCYGDCRREVGYAIKHLGIEWQDLSA